MSSTELYLPIMTTPLRLQLGAAGASCPFLPCFLFEWLDMGVAPNVSSPKCGQLG